MQENGPPRLQVNQVASLESPEYDAVIFVHPPNHVPSHPIIKKTLEAALKYDPALASEIAILPINDLPAWRLVATPTGPIDPDYDDVRLFKKAAEKGMQRALKAGIKKPLLFIDQYKWFENDGLVVLLGCLQALYVPIQVREINPSRKSLIDYLGVITPNIDRTEKLTHLALLLNKGCSVACDIGDADPERMSPPKIEQYIASVFRNSPIKLTIIKDSNQIKQEYPLFDAVNRGASSIERHQGRIIILDYTPDGDIKESLFFVGKGVTYDTGGVDVKINGAMVGMSRDKCGAAAVVGLMDIVKTLKPKNIRVVGAVSLVRNSIGANSYVPDEVITARSGARVRIVNTDAEGRMAMADVLCKMKELALEAINPHLFTIATLTGHACLTVGEGYSIDNGPAKIAKNSKRLQSGGDLVGDVFEISMLRREDFDFHKGEAVGDDLRQGNNQPSTRTARGHQGPAAFLILAAGLDKHGSNSEKPIKFSHLDIAASAGEYPKPATGSPVLALAQTYLLN